MQDIIIGAYNRYGDQVGEWKNLPNAGRSQLSLTRRSEGKPVTTKESEIEKTPTIPIDIINGMPALIHNIAIMLKSEREKDTFVTGVRLKDIFCT